jgi:hypothetical protein
MLSHLMHSKTAWNDYFSGTTPSNYGSQLYTERKTLSDTYVYVSDCLFRSISSSSTGGALYCTSTYLLIESTSFFSCKTSNSCQGGAIYFSNSGGQCVLHEVCGYDCTTTTEWDYQFARIYVKDDVSSKNYVNYSSISRCVNEISGAYYTMYLGRGKICFPSVNISMNRINCRAIYFCPFVDSSSVTCSLTYCTFADNYATTYTCIFLWRTGAKFEIKCCNIIRNTQGTLGSEGTIYTCGDLFIDDSCILENTATYNFRQGDSNYRITLSNCTADSTSNDGYLTTKSRATKSFIHALNHMSTKNCRSE